MKTHQEYKQQFDNNIAENKLKYNKDKFTMEEYAKILFPNK